MITVRGRRPSCCSRHKPDNIKGKGYPDVASRVFLRRISAVSLPTPIYALVDFDPDGLAIMSVYKRGSTSLAHEAKALATPNVMHLGVCRDDIQAIVNGGEDGRGEESARRAARALSELSARDRKKAVQMLQRLYDSEAEEAWRLELQVMLMLGFKAEIEVLEHARGGLHAWLEEKLTQRGGTVAWRLHTQSEMGDLWSYSSLEDEK